MIELFEDQKLAVDKLKNGSILVGGVGSGKSITSLAYYFIKVCGGEYYDVFRKPTQPMDLYIITTAKKRDDHDWEQECSHFILSTDTSVSVCGIKVTIDSWNNIGKYVGVKDAFFIFDEQRVVGYGKWSKSFIKIARQNKWILLSATPGDCWFDYMPVFIANGYYKNKKEFVHRHVVYKPFTNYPIVDHYINEERLEAIRDDILIEMDTEKKTIRHEIFISPEYDKELFLKVTKECWNIYKDEPIINSAEHSLVLRRIINSDPDRIRKTLDILKTHNAIIFYNFDYELELLREMCVENNISFGEWNGHKHQSIPKDRSKRWCYLVQYNAGSEGWNCIDTDTAIFFSLNHSYKMTEQATGRIDRRNTPFVDLYYYKMVSKCWLDRAILNCLRAKKDFNDRKFRDTLSQHETHNNFTLYNERR